MKIKTNVAVFKKAAEIAIKAVANRATISAIESFKIETQGDKINIIGWNLSNAIICPCPAEIEEEGSCLIEARILTAILSKTSGALEIYDDGKTVQIKCGRSHYKIASQDAALFPELPVIRSDNEVEISGKDFKTAYKKISPCIRENPSKPIMGGMLIDVQSNKTNFVGCDGCRVSVVEVPHGSVEPKKIIITKETMKNMSSVVDEENNIKILIGSSKVKIVTRGVTFIASAFDGDEYFEYNSLFTDNGVTSMFDVNLNEFKSSIEASTPLVEVFEKNPIKLHICDDDIRIQSDSSLGRMVTNCQIKPEKTEDTILGINAKYVLDALNAFGDDEVTIKVKAPTLPVIINNKDESVKTLILPMRIRSAA